MFGFDKSDGAPGSSGLLDRGKAILSILLQMGRNRLELAANEIQEEYERFWPLLIKTLVSLVLLAFGAFFASVFIIVLFWDTHRLLALGGVAGLYLIMGTLFARHVICIWTKRRRLFSSTIEELEKDIRSLNGDGVG